jgi:tripartite-type tricarboxylate transporter receptor subunit TctC
VDLIGGHTSFQMCAPVVCAPRIQDGSVKALGIASRQRSKLLPDVPTLAEAGAPGVEAGTWWYLAAPRGTAAEVIRKLNAALNDVMADEAYRNRLLAIGVEVEPGATPVAVRNGLLAEMDKWRPVVKAAGLTN